MIIVEGPDGAGKSSLIEKLSITLSIPVHERASDSVGGPVSNISVWAYNDVTAQPSKPLSIYDRHPLISEYVYGPIVRQHLSPDMLSPTMHLCIRMLARQALVIFCRPPIEEIARNVVKAPQMSGVAEHIGRIISAYDALRMFWPGRSLLFDYTDPSSFTDILTAARLHTAHWRRHND